MELDNNIQGEVMPEITANYIKDNCTSCPKKKRVGKIFIILNMPHILNP